MQKFFTIWALGEGDKTSMRQYNKRADLEISPPSREKGDGEHIHCAVKQR